MHSGWAARSTVCKQVSQSEVVWDTFCCYFGGFSLDKTSLQAPAGAQGLAGGLLEVQWSVSNPGKLTGKHIDHIFTVRFRDHKRAQLRVFFNPFKISWDPPNTSKFTRNYTGARWRRYGGGSRVAAPRRLGGRPDRRRGGRRRKRGNQSSDPDQ